MVEDIDLHIIGITTDISDAELGMMRNVHER